MTDPEPPDDRYLWDRSGPSDPDLAALERVLEPLAHRAGPKAVLPAEPRRPASSPRRAAAIAALAAVAAGVGFLALSRPGAVPNPSPSPPAPGPIVVESRDGESDETQSVAVGEWLHAAADEREVLLGDVGRLRLFPGSRLRLDRLAADSARFFLERGRLEASIAASVPQRFFQVDTSAARCVDLGCRYTLEVDGRGVAFVRVTSGRVSFEAPGREVYVPAGATCVARPADGPGTPRFEDAPAPLVEAVDALDAAAAGAAERRRALADRVLALADTRRQALVTWHLLQDPDAEIARRAEASLGERFGDGRDPSPAADGRPTREARERWKDRLSLDW